MPRPFPGAPAPPPTYVSPSTPDSSEATSSTEAAEVPLRPPAIAKAVVTTALTLRGTPYRRGGSEPSQGFDCSGLVQWVFAQHGSALPRDVKQQFVAGRKIDAHHLRPGDLVFFHTVSEGPSHVGIAIGGGEFVHAPASRGVVRVERLSNSYWSKRWIGARRITASNTARAAD
ncbi:MAG TPA: C40 family peptidase [Vicinamibacterales bacterium]|nr:C40 family peptidase [Vicinamibacterales bacterium]